MASEAETKATGPAAEGSVTPPGTEPAKTPSGAPAGAGARFGGARADFVASLGRKTADARAVLAALDAEPEGRGPRDELRRKLHALGAAARMLRFEAMARCIAEAAAVLDRAAQVGSASPGDLAHLAEALDDIPALAWGETGPRDASGIPEPASSAPVLHRIPLSALVVGAAALADMLGEEGEATFFECERTESAAAAIGLARALAPDVVVVDGDLAGALGLVESLLDDPLTEPVPIIVTGEFRVPDQAARFVALGVAKTLTKPVAPTTLRRACQEVIDQREGRTVRVSLGEPTLEQLGERLADEVRRALVESVDAVARSCRVPLGEGSEVLGAMWGAIARVREVITERTDGVVRFTGTGPEGAVPLAPWLHHDVAAGDRMPRRGRGAAVDVSLDKRVIIVADDDPGVTWFIADLLRTTGCTVHEALDGKRALALAYEHSPQLIVSDILMPELDGFGLCRAIRRDVVLRDVPVILLSWKEDLLQRVRELGASAAAYLRKESDARSIVARVREVLRPRARVEARLRGEGEVRGRLDDLTVHSLLELVCATRPSSRVSIRDASFLYEVEIRDGAPRRASRTAGDGTFQRGERVIAAMLGVGAARFVVAPSNSTAPIGDLTGTLAEQLARPIALAREAAAAITGARTMNVDRVVLDEETVAAYLLATPEPARGIIHRIAQGESPRTMLLKGEVAPSLLEDVLADLATRGAILQVRDVRGDDLLDPNVDRSLDSVTRVAARAPTPSPTPASDLVARELPAIAEASRRASGRARDLTPDSAKRPESGSPSSLEDAVMRAMSDGKSAEQPPIIEPSELRPRSSNPPADPPAADDDAFHLIGSLPPDAVVPATSSGDMLVGAPVPGSEDAQAPAAKERSKTIPSRARQAEAAAAIGRRPAEVRPPPNPNVSLTPPAERRWRLFIVLCVFVFVVGGGIRWYGTPHAPAPVYEDRHLPSAPPSIGDGTKQTFASVPPDVSVPKGSGLLDLTIAEGAPLHIDGNEIRPPHEGRRVRLPLPAGRHEIRVGSGAQEKLRIADVREGLATQIVLTDLP